MTLLEAFKSIIILISTNDGHHFTTGKINLNGEQALSFVRMRYEDPNGDFGRQERQRQVIQGVINRGASFSSLTSLVVFLPH